MWRWTGVVIAIVVLAGIGVLTSSGGKKKPTAVKPTTAPGSIRKGEPVSKHFESVLERLSDDTFRISVLGDVSICCRVPMNSWSPST